MGNLYLSKKIRNLEWLEVITLLILVITATMIGKYFTETVMLGLIGGLILGLFSVICIFLIEGLIKKQIPYQKGFDFELKVEKKLEKLNNYFESHFDVQYGDLDFYVNKKGAENAGNLYGIEAKDWPGEVVFKDGELLINGFDHTDILVKLLRHCALARNKKFGESSSSFINPVLVFGYKTIVKIPENKIRFRNTDIIVATIRNFEKFL